MEPKFLFVVGFIWLSFIPDIEGGSSEESGEIYGTFLFMPSESHGFSQGEPDRSIPVDSPRFPIQDNTASPTLTGASDRDTAGSPVTDGGIALRGAFDLTDSQTGQTSGQTAGQTSGQMAGQTGGQTAGQTGGQMAGQTGGQTAGQTGGQTVGQTGGQATGQTGAGQTGGRPIEQTAVQTAGQTNRSPVFNIWEFAMVHGPRTGGAPPAGFAGSSVGLNRCEWAVVSCCASSSRRRQHDCFEGLHCSGAWFSNPCAPRLQQAVYELLLQQRLTQAGL
ncbi:uncharacterized transmembrane protein DDB_G0289901-like [Hyalella azteca]|uniref:Uncharacterized transmembrane protein DDB_G0289901-like n=1 Tax=Hyalella azteca TaxID=294128 RepID=A0A8B7PJC1_HYAAZ|nr:uncharacterized transmembrane protein DDB_G0289901-like [Hyalella azteca]